MKQYAPYLGAILAVFVFVLFSAGSGVSEVQILPAESNVEIIVPVVSTSTEELPKEKPAQVEQVPPAEKKLDVAPTLTTAASTLRTALVNILCTAENGSAAHSISGSGVVISSSGHVLTNAHVGQYLLLKDRGVKCVARTGSPAQGSYGVALAYLSPAWVMSNSRNIVDPAPMGTGEHDVAVLVITDSRHTFPYVTLGNNVPQHEEPVAIVSYAAQYLDANELASALYPTIVLSHVKEILTFSESNTPDVLGFSGSVAAQEGASGGGVVDAQGVLVGTVTTSSVTGPTQERFITAITAQYVRSEYAIQTGRELGSLLSMSPAASVATFSSEADNLKAILEDVLDSQ